MLVLYITPPLLVLLAPLHGSLGAAGLGGLAWLLMTAAYMPTIAYYGLRPAAALTLSLAAVLYTAMTIDSAWRHRRGRGGGGKGRHYSRGGRDRKRDGAGKGVSVRVDTGGRR